MSKSKSSITIQMKKRFINYIYYLADSYGLRLLIVAPFILGLVIGSVWITIGKSLYGSLPYIPNLIVAYITFFHMGIFWNHHNSKARSAGNVLFSQRYLCNSYWSIAYNFLLGYSGSRFLFISDKPYQIKIGRTCTSPPD
jgi:hypothetical protein